MYKNQQDCHMQRDIFRDLIMMETLKTISIKPKELYPIKLMIHYENNLA